MDYLLFYQLQYNPFDKTQDILLPLTDYKEMHLRLDYLKQHQGIGLFTGSPGVGKTYTLKKFVDSLNESLHYVCYLTLTTVTVMDFYRSLAFALGLEPMNKKIDLFHAIQERLIYLSTNQKKIPVIIIDEAQYLKTAILQDLTMLFNFEMDSVQHAIIILAGLPMLSVALSRAPLEPLKQRIITQYQVIGIDTSEVAQYIEVKLQKAGRQTPLFEPAAITALSQNAGGSIRKLNTLITQAFLIGQIKNKPTIDEEIIFQASQELSIG